MTYREKTLNAYRESLIAYGANELTIKTALIAFQTGYEAGVLHKSGESVQKQMETTLLQEETLN